MSKADELLDEMIEQAASEPMTMSSNDISEPHMVIGKDRFITVPEELKKIAVQYDHNIETVTFDCPRYWDGHDMSKMVIYINYMRADDDKAQDLASNVIVDELDDNLMHFNWTITGHLSEVPGPIAFLVCIQKVNADGSQENHWNSEINTDLYVSKGMECEAKMISVYPGIITSVLARMQFVEDKTTHEKMLGYVAEYLTDTSPTWLSKFFASEEMMAILNNYISEHGVAARTSIIVSDEQPAFECLWFDTSDRTSQNELDINTSNVVIGSSKPYQKSLWLNTGKE